SKAKPFTAEHAESAEMKMSQETRVSHAYLGVLGDLGGNVLLPARYFFRTVKHFHCSSLFLCAPLRAVLIRSRNERAEQRMRLERLRLELRMELAADEVRMIRQFHHLYIS